MIGDNFTLGVVMQPRRATETLVKTAISLALEFAARKGATAETPATLHILDLGTGSSHPKTPKY